MSSTRTPIHTAWPGLIEAYRDRLPDAANWTPVTLHEGGTPLVHAKRISEQTGCTVHLVDAGTDTGPVLAQEPVAVFDDDDEDSLHERIKTVERKLLVDVLAALATRGVTWTGRKATIG